MRNRVHIIGGGTINHITNHFSLCAYAQGGTARRLSQLFKDNHKQLKVETYLSKMAGGNDFHTTDQLSDLVDRLKVDPQTRIIIMNAAVCDFYSTEMDSEYLSRPPKEDFSLKCSPTKNIIGNIRDKKHKKIFLVGFKNTVGLNSDEMYKAGLNLCKTASCNLVFVNDTLNMHNMIVTPEEATYADGYDRVNALKELAEMSVLRSHLTFTQSTVISGESINWNSTLVPDNLRKVVDHCIGEKAYKVFNGSTVGHFATKLDDQTFLTSIRRSNFNDLYKVGLVKIITDSPDTVLAYGAKPSVGGQSQRQVFSDHEGMDCIVHFHCPLKVDHKDAIPIVSQREVECGSHECGANTSNNLGTFGNIKAVMLDNHGPNIVFSKDIDPNEIISFIDDNFDLHLKTGGYNL